MRCARSSQSKAVWISPPSNAVTPFRHAISGDAASWRVSAIRLQTSAIMLAKRNRSLFHFDGNDPKSITNRIESKNSCGRFKSIAGKVLSHQLPGIGQQNCAL
jgi:hypothetical protein